MAKKLITKNNKLIKVDGQILAIESENAFKKILDHTKSARSIFEEKRDVKTLNGYIETDDTENVTTTEKMFYFCQGLQSIPPLNLKNTTKASNMFEYCSSLQEISLKNTENITHAYRMFSECSKLTSLTGFKPTGLTSAQQLFYMCKKLTNIDIPDLSLCSSVDGVFSYCESLEEVPEYISFPNATSAASTFNECRGLRTLNRTIELPKATSINYLCGNNQWACNLKIIADVATNVSNLCAYCYRLRTCEINCLDSIKSNNANTMFVYCYNLKYIIIRTMNNIPAIGSNFIRAENDDYEKNKYIYVPDEYVEQLKTATNWSAFADYIYPLSELPQNYNNESFIWGFRTFPSTTYPRVYVTGGSVSGVKINQFKAKDGGSCKLECLFFVGDNDSNTINIHGKLNTKSTNIGLLKINIYAVDGETIIDTWDGSNNQDWIEYSTQISNIAPGQHRVYIELITNNTSGSSTMKDIADVSVDFVEE